MSMKRGASSNDNLNRMTMPSLRSKKPCRHQASRLRQVPLPFLSLPYEIRCMIYPLLWRPKTFYGAPWTVFFEANEYGENESILHVNQQIRAEALGELYRHTTWALKIVPVSPAYLGDMVWGWKFLRRVELKFMMQDVLATLARDQTYMDIRQTNIETFEGRMESLAKALERMSSLQTVVLTWEEESLTLQHLNPSETTETHSGHSLKRCFLGCRYPGGPPSLPPAVIPEWEHLLTDKQKLTQKAMKAYKAYMRSLNFWNHPLACPTVGLDKPEQRIDHFWEQVLVLQKLLSRVLEPLRRLPATCEFVKGPIELWCGGGSNGKRCHVMERAFSTCVDALMLIRKEEKLELKDALLGEDSSQKVKD